MLISEQDEDIILGQARKLDKMPREERELLHEIAVGLKDIIHTKGMCSSIQITKC